MRISIITPSYKQPEWLRLCAASVADQTAPGLEIEHLVQDSMSGPEIAQALSPFPRVKLISEKDEGMYDAINRGWEKATGDILCWLNCDEQYLPGALAEVAAYFQAHPEADVLLADTVVVDGEGNYMCSRQALVPLLYHIWTCSLPTLSSSIFFRSSLFKERGFRMDTRWKDLGDAVLMVRMLRAHVGMGVLRRYISVFVDSGDNRNLKPLARQEREALTRLAPLWVQALSLLWMLAHRLRRLIYGLYWPKPFDYSIYTPESPRRRIRFEVLRPTFFWKTRMKFTFNPLRRKTPSAAAAPDAMNPGRQGASPAIEPRGANPSPQRHLFIVGFFRSGTSLLYRLLNLHPEIRLLFETGLQAHRLVDVSSGIGQKWWERLDFYNSCISRHHLTVEPSWGQVRSSREAAELLYRQYGGDQRRYIGEKSPGYYARLSTLARNYPQARFLVIWRNPQDVISSILAAGRKHYFFRNRALVLRSLVGIEQMQADTLALRARGAKVYDFCYEDLIENTEATLRSICEFLELPFDPRMLDLEKADSSMFPVGEHHSKAKSDRIVKSSRAESPDVELIQPKIRRYLTRYQARFQDQLATRRYWKDASGDFPGRLEVMKDRLAYIGARNYYEKIAPIIYGLFPFSWLQSYRRWRER